MWAETDANGTRFELGAERVTVSTRAKAGPLRFHLLCSPTPAGRLRAYCRLTGFAPVLPEWGYGFWKSRDFHEHRDDVYDDFNGFRGHGIPLDAIMLDSPWETQYNTWEFNPHEFPDAEGMVAELRAAGVRTVAGRRRGRTSTRATGRSRRRPSRNGCTGSRTRTTRRRRWPATSSGVLTGSRS